MRINKYFYLKFKSIFLKNLNFIRSSTNLVTKPVIFLFSVTSLLVIFFQNCSIENKVTSSSRSDQNKNSDATPFIIGLGKHMDWSWYESNTEPADIPFTNISQTLPLTEDIYLLQSEGGITFYNFKTNQKISFYKTESVSQLIPYGIKNRVAIVSNSKLFIYDYIKEEVVFTTPEFFGQNYCLTDPVIPDKILCPFESKTRPGYLGGAIINLNSLKLTDIADLPGTEQRSYYWWYTEKNFILPKEDKAVIANNVGDKVYLVSKDSTIEINDTFTYDFLGDGKQLTYAAAFTELNSIISSMSTSDNNCLGESYEEVLKNYNRTLGNFDYVYGLKSVSNGILIKKNARLVCTQNGMLGHKFIEENAPATLVLCQTPDDCVPLSTKIYNQSETPSEVVVSLDHNMVFQSSDLGSYPKGRIFRKTDLSDLSSSLQHFDIPPVYRDLNGNGYLDYVVNSVFRIYKGVLIHPIAIVDLVSGKQIQFQYPDNQEFLDNFSDFNARYFFKVGEVYYFVIKMHFKKQNSDKIVVIGSDGSYKETDGSIPGRNYYPKTPDLNKDHFFFLNNTDSDNVAEVYKYDLNDHKTTLVHDPEDMAIGDFLDVLDLDGNKMMVFQRSNSLNKTITYYVNIQENKKELLYEGSGNNSLVLSPLGDAYIWGQGTEVYYYNPKTKIKKLINDPVTGENIGKNYTNYVDGSFMSSNGKEYLIVSNTYIIDEEGNVIYKLDKSSGNYGAYSVNEGRFSFIKDEILTLTKLNKNEATENPNDYLYTVTNLDLNTQKETQMESYVVDGSGKNYYFYRNSKFGTLKTTYANGQTTIEREGHSPLTLGNYFRTFWGSKTFGYSVDSFNNFKLYVFDLESMKKVIIDDSKGKYKIQVRILPDHENESYMVYTLNNKDPNHYEMKIIKVR